MKCPDCQIDLIFIEEAHVADQYYYCRICGATWSEGKLPEEDHHENN